MTDFATIFSAIFGMFSAITGSPMLLVLLIVGAVSFFILASRGGLPLAIVIFVPLLLLLANSPFMGGGTMPQLVPDWVIIFVLMGGALVMMLAYTKYFGR